MLLNQHQQKLAATVVDVLPALSLLASVLANPLSLLISHLLPSSKRTTLENTSSFFSNELGELDRQLLKIFGLTLYLLESSDSPSKI